MSVLPKATKRLSELSKIDIIPKREIGNVANLIVQVESLAKSLSKTEKIEPVEFDGLIKEIKEVAESLDAIEKKYPTIIENSDRYNKSLNETTKLQKFLKGNIDKYKQSTDEIFIK